MARCNKALFDEMSVSWQDSQTPQCVSKKSPAEDEGKEEKTATQREKRESTETQVNYCT